MDEGDATALRTAEEGPEPRGHRLLPIVTNDERDFWRRAVAAVREPDDGVSREKARRVAPRKR